MIKTLSVTNHIGQTLTIDMADPEKSGFAIKDIKGINPVKASIHITEFTSMDGGIFNSSHASFRNIVITLGLLAKPTVEFMRQESYKYFPISKEVELEIVTDTGTYVIEGHVEDNDVNIFSKDEMELISIICPNPHFHAKSLQNTIFTGVTSLFKFPFSNESLTEKLIKFGSLAVNTKQTLSYIGDVDAGVVIYIHLLGSVSDLSIYNLTNRQAIKIDTTKLVALTGENFKAGDNIILSTVKGDKFITLERDGVVYNLLNTIYKNTVWFTISKGENLFAYSASEGVLNVQLRIENAILFVGV